MSLESERSSRGGLALALLLALVGCGDGGEIAPEAEPREVAPGPTTPRAQAPPAPAEDAAGASQRGAQHYAALCATCHGARGEADTPIAEALTPKPARHSDGAYMNALSDEQLFTVIKRGGPAVGKSPLMAAWGGALTDAQIRDVVAFIRTLADPPYPQPAG